MSTFSNVPEPTSARLESISDASSYLQSLPEAASNSGLVVGTETTLVIDTRLTPELGRNLRSLVRATHGQRPARLLVVNTHFHGDHWFGNGAFGDVEIVASDWTRRKLAEDWRDQVALFSKIRPAQAGDFEGVTADIPTVGIHGQVDLDLGGSVASVLPVGHAHTPGDVVVLTEDGAVAYAGDVVVNGHWPVFWDADIAGWQAALAGLRARGPRTVVPGHGPAGGFELVDQMLRCLRFLIRLAELENGRWEAEIEASPFREWLHRGRVEPAVATIRAQLAGAATKDR